MKVKLLSFVTIEPITILFKVGSWDELDGMGCWEGWLPGLVG